MANKRKFKPKIEMNLTISGKRYGDILAELSRLSEKLTNMYEVGGEIWSDHDHGKAHETHCYVKYLP